MNKYPFLGSIAASMQRFDVSPFDFDDMVYDLEMIVEYELDRAGRKYIQDGAGQRLVREDT